MAPKWRTNLDTTHSSSGCIADKKGEFDYFGKIGWATVEDVRLFYESVQEAEIQS